MTLSSPTPFNTDTFYQDSVKAGFVKAQAIARNIEWVSDTAWGPLQITINLSKPEKDPADIAKAALNKANADHCDLCVTQADIDSGYAKNITLCGEPWALWYSPYAYYKEHCIAMSWKHRPMHIDRAAFEGLCDFVDQFPHYFIGSNADLPLVGGSILGHDHFQGGRHAFPLAAAPLARSFRLADFPTIEAGVVKWPVTTLRLRTADRNALVDACELICTRWRSYSDETAGVIALTTGDDGARIAHNTLTPMLRKYGALYEMDLSLRCNITSAEHPLGVFHPHAHLHRIKKENIGLIEVMGRAILPGRLASEMDLSQAWVQAEIGDLFAEVLECCGVFKWSNQGQRGLDDFIAALNL